MSYPLFDSYSLGEIIEIASSRLKSCDKTEDIVFRSAKYRLLVDWMIKEISKLPLTENKKCANIMVSVTQDGNAITVDSPLVFIDGHWRPA